MVERTAATHRVRIDRGRRALVERPRFWSSPSLLLRRSRLDASSFDLQTTNRDVCSRDALGAPASSLDRGRASAGGTGDGFAQPRGGLHGPCGPRLEKRLEDTPGDVPEPSPLRCSDSPRTGGPASDATQPLSHRGAALATGRSDGLPSCSPHLLHLETSARGLGRPSSNRVTVEMGPSTPTPLAPSARPEAETLARSRRFCHLLAPRARDRRVTHLARPEDPLGGRTYESGWALRSPGEHGPASGSGSRPRRRRRPLTPVSDASRERGCLGVKSRRATPLVVARGSTTARRRSRR